MKPSFNRLTGPAERLVGQISQRAIDRGFFGVDEASIVPLALWTLIRWERKVGLATLELMGVDLHSLADKLDALLTQFKTEQSVRIRNGTLVNATTRDTVVRDVLTLLQPLLKQAESEGRQLKHNYVGSEHLLLAIIKCADSRMSAILQDHLITYECTKESVCEFLDSISW
jgi:ATP-dependent Clp protease ATP-binding subunit ClpA